MNEFLEQIAEVLEQDNVQPTAELTSFEAWDSLAQLSIIALADENYGITISAEQILQARTIEGLWELLNSK